MTITFCGHAEIADKAAVQQSLPNALSNYIDDRKDEFVCFLCGGYGDFDFLAEKVIDEVKKRYPRLRTEKVYVTPYIGESHKERLAEMSKRFDGIVYPPLESVPFRFAISKRNEWMVNRSDVVFVYVIHPWGGAYKMSEYAKRKKKQMISI